jgi:hypothetical protein
MFCSDVEVTVRSAGDCSGGSDQGGKQTGRPEHKGMTAAAKTTPRREVAVAGQHGSPTHLPLGKADVAGEVTGMSTLQTVAAGVQASWERLAEITSGRTFAQPGLVATGKDRSHEARPEVGGGQRFGA